MRKRIVRYVFFLGFLTILIVASIPVVVGYLFKSRYQDLVEAVNHQGHVTIKIVAYQLGWLHSTATLSISPEALVTNMKKTSGVEMVNAVPIIMVQQTVTHGPFVYDTGHASWKVALAFIESSVNMETPNKILQNIFHPQVTTLATFDNDYISTFQTNGIGEISVDAETKVTWQGLNGNTHLKMVEDTLKSVMTDVKSLPFSVRIPEGSLSVQSADFQGEVNCEQPDACQNKGAFGLSNINFSDQDGQAKIGRINLSMSQNLTTDQSINGSTQLSWADVEGKIKGQQLKIGGVNLVATYAPGPNGYMVGFQATANKVNVVGYALDFANFNLKVDGLNAAEFSKVAEKLRTSQDEFNPYFFLSLLTPMTTAYEVVVLNTAFGNFTLQSHGAWPKEQPLPKTQEELFKNHHATTKIRASIPLVDHVISILDGTDQESQDADSKSDVAKAVKNRINIDDEIMVLMRDKKVGEDVGNALIEMHKNHFSSSLYSASINKFVENNQLTPEIAAQPKKLYAEQDADSSSATNPITTADMPSNAFDAKVKQLTEQKEISEETASSLIALEKTRLSPSIFNSGLDQLVEKQALKPEVAQQLKEQYALTGVTGGANDAVTEKKEKVDPNSARAQFDALVKEGMVKEEGNDYVVSIIHEKGVLSVNGIVVPMS